MKLYKINFFIFFFFFFFFGYFTGHGSISWRPLRHFLTKEFQRRLIYQFRPQLFFLLYWSKIFGFFFRFFRLRVNNRDTLTRSTKVRKKKGGKFSVNWRIRRIIKNEWKTGQKKWIYLGDITLKKNKDEKCLFVFTSPSPWFHVVIKQNNNNNNNKKKKKINKFPPLVFWSLAFSLFPSLSLLIFCFVFIYSLSLYLSLSVEFHIWLICCVFVWNIYPLVTGVFCWDRRVCLQCNFLSFSLSFFLSSFLSAGQTAD